MFFNKLIQERSLKLSHHLLSQQNVKGI